MRGRRVASHLRSAAVVRHTTEPAHMPESHTHRRETAGAGLELRMSSQTDLFIQLRDEFLALVRRYETAPRSISR